MKEDFYINKEGNTVFRSSFYKKKGSCCKSSCLHCPYGHTLRTIGLEAFEISKDFLNECKDIFDFYHKKDAGVQSLLDSAFGSTKKESFDKDSYFGLSLKDQICAIAKKSNPEKYYLHPEFNDQGIDYVHILPAIEALRLHK